MQRQTSGNNGQQQKKQYTFLNLKQAVKKDGGTYLAVTMEALVNKPSDLKVVGQDSQVINFTCPINNRTDYLSKMLGTQIVDKDGTVWARVNVWNRVAGRLNSLLDKVDSLTLIVTGSIHLSYGGDQGQYQNIEVTADDFIVLRSKAIQQNAPQAAPQQAMPVQPQAIQQMAPVYDPAPQAVPQMVQQPVPQYVPQPQPQSVPVMAPEVMDAGFAADGFIPVDESDEDLPF